MNNENEKSSECLDNKSVLVGRVSTAHGLNGELKVRSFCQPIENICHYTPWLVKSNAGNQVLEADFIRIQGKYVIVKFDDCFDRTKAETFVNSEIYTSEDNLPSLNEGDFYWKDLEGLSVLTQDNKDLGTVVKILATGANDVLLVKALDQDEYGIKERLIPFVLPEIVQEVNIKDRKIHVDWDASYQ